MAAEITPTARDWSFIRAHLRFRYSLLLAPSFLWIWALSSPENQFSGKAALTFGALQLGLYPASQGLNSVHDRDEGPIGGLAAPPPIPPGLLPAANLLDGLAVLTIGLLRPEAGVLALAYSLASRAYSHPRTRWKAQPWLGWATVTVFQGPVVSLLAALSLDPSLKLTTLAWEPVVLSALFFAGSYPLTQIYQHAEDARRGDRTLSRILGVQGTFRWWFAWSVATAAAFGLYFGLRLQQPVLLLPLALALLPSAAHTARWAARCRNTAPAHGDAMRAAILASAGICTFLVLFGLYRAVSAAGVLGR